MCGSRLSFLHEISPLRNKISPLTTIRCRKLPLFREYLTIVDLLFRLGSYQGWKLGKSDQTTCQTQLEVRSKNGTQWKSNSKILHIWIEVRPLFTFRRIHSSSCSAFERLEPAKWCHRDGTTFDSRSVGLCRTAGILCFPSSVLLPTSGLFVGLQSQQGIKGHCPALC